MKAALLACAVAALAATPTASAAGSCQTSVVDDYAAPLAALPRLPQLPAGRTTLPFRPHGVVVTHRPPEKVLLIGSEAGDGFVLSAVPGRRRAAHPGWLVSSRLALVSATGATERVLETNRARVDKLVAHSPVRLGLHAPGEPGYYRAEIVFRNRSRERIARYGDYFRVLAGDLDVRFVLDRTALHPGETIDPRLENVGGAYLTFGLGAPIEVMQGGAWAPAPFGNGPVPAIAMVIGPGVASSCWQTTIPPDAAPGGYRVGLHFSYQTRTGRLPIGSAETRYAEFTVSP